MDEEFASSYWNMPWVYIALAMEIWKSLICPPTKASTATMSCCLYQCDACTLRAVHITFRSNKTVNMVVEALEVLFWVAYDDFHRKHEAQQIGVWSAMVDFTKGTNWGVRSHWLHPCSIFCGVLPIPSKLYRNIVFHCQTWIYSVL